MDSLIFKVFGDMLYKVAQHLDGKMVQQGHSVERVDLFMVPKPCGCCNWFVLAFAGVALQEGVFLPDGNGCQKAEIYESLDAAYYAYSKLKEFNLKPNQK